MKQKIYNFLLLGLFLIMVPTTAHASEPTIASTDVSTAFTYEEMISDINMLCDTYPDYVTQRNIGSSVEGRSIPLVILGKESAPRKVCVQSTIHAREYLCTQVSIDMIEYYASQYSQGNLTDMLNKTCFYIVPMVNPDGVSIAQFGVNATNNKATKAFIKSQPTTTRWKANNNGVDLNRNWNAGWEGVDNKGYTGQCH